MEDAQGLICAVDTAFMSTGLQRKTPIHYMQEDGPNVLWEMHPSQQTDDGYHRGADIKMLSQFAAEDEVLFPPCTMLGARKRGASKRQAATCARPSFLALAG